MAFRIFIVVLLLANILFLYQVVQLNRAHAALYNVPEGYSIGPANADVSLVEFLDYSCPHCRAIDPVIREAIQRDGKTRYIPRPVPTQIPGSVKYARAVYAAGQQGKFIEMHIALMENFRAMDEENLAEMAVDLGMDKEKFLTDMTPEKADEYLKKNSWLLANFYTPSMPHFIINGRIAFSPEKKAPGVDDFLSIFREARAAQ